MPSHKAGGNWGDVVMSEKASERAVLAGPAGRHGSELCFPVAVPSARAPLFLPLSCLVLSRSPSEFRPYVLDPGRSLVPFSAQLACLLALSLFGPLGT